MRTFPFAFILLLSVTGPVIGQEKIDFARDVLPLVGTGGHEHTFPGASVPFGFVQLSPDTPQKGWDGCAGYYYDNGTILGFSHTHFSGTGPSVAGARRRSSGVLRPR